MGLKLAQTLIDENIRRAFVALFHSYKRMYKLYDRFRRTPHEEGYIPPFKVPLTFDLYGGRIIFSPTQQYLNVREFGAIPASKCERETHFTITDYFTNEQVKHLCESFRVAYSQLIYILVTPIGKKVTTIRSIIKAGWELDDPLLSLDQIEKIPIEEQGTPQFILLDLIRDYDLLTRSHEKIDLNQPRVYRKIVEVDVTPEDKMYAVRAFFLASFFYTLGDGGSYPILDSFAKTKLGLDPSSIIAGKPEQVIIVDGHKEKLPVWDGNSKSVTWEIGLPDNKQKVQLRYWEDKEIFTWGKLTTPTSPNPLPNQLYLDNAIGASAGVFIILELIKKFGIAEAIIPETLISKTIWAEFRQDLKEILVELSFIPLGTDITFEELNKYFPSIMQEKQIRGPQAQNSAFKVLYEKIFWDPGYDWSFVIPRVIEEMPPKVIMFPPLDSIFVSDESPYENDKMKLSLASFLSNGLKILQKKETREIFLEKFQKLNKEETPDPGKLKRLREYADKLFQNGNSNDAREVYKQYLAANPNDAEVWLNLGIMSIRVRKRTRAEAELRECLRIDPNNKNARQLLKKLLEQ